MSAVGMEGHRAGEDVEPLIKNPAQSFATPGKSGICSFSLPDKERKDVSPRAPCAKVPELSPFTVHLCQYQKVELAVDYSYRAAELSAWEPPYQGISCCPCPFLPTPTPEVPVHTPKPAEHTHPGHLSCRLLPQHEQKGEAGEDGTTEAADRAFNTPRVQQP